MSAQPVIPDKFARGLANLSLALLRSWLVANQAPAEILKLADNGTYLLGLIDDGPEKFSLGQEAYNRELIDSTITLLEAAGQLGAELNLYEANFDRFERFFQKRNSALQ